MVVLVRWIASFGGVLFIVADYFIGRLLILFGVGMISYAGISTSLDWLVNRMLEALGNTPNNVLSLLSYMQIGTCINIIITAIMTKMAIKGMTGDTAKRWVLKGKKK